MSTLTVTDLAKRVESGELVKLHTAKTSGYQSRKGSGTVVSYKGKFGEGFAHYSPSWDSTRYCYITYYVNK